MSPTTRRRVSYVAVGAAALFASVVGVLWLNRPRPAPISRDLIAALTLETVAQLYRAQHTGCPTLAQVRSWTGESPRLRVNDGWATPFRLTCTRDGGVTVQSAGPDRRFGSADDLGTDNEGPWPKP